VGLNARFGALRSTGRKTEQAIETVFPSRSTSGLDEIVAKFADQLTAQNLQWPRAACLRHCRTRGHGRSGTSNSAVVVESTH